MTRTTRRLIFYAAILLFVALSYVVLMYAQGYAYSFEDNRFIRTGSIFLKVNTSGDIYRDGKLVGSTSFIGDAIIQSRLLPGQYRIEVKKDGYTTWQKDILVQDGQVSEFLKVLILPTTEENLDEIRKDLEIAFISPSPSPLLTNSPSPLPVTSVSPSPSPFFDSNERFKLVEYILFENFNNFPLKISENVTGFRVSPDQDKLSWWNQNEIWVKWLEDTNYQPLKIKGEQDLITRFAKTIRGDDWFYDNDHLVVRFETTLGSSPSYEITELDKRGGINIIEL